MHAGRGYHPREGDGVWREMEMQMEMNPPSISCNAAESIHATRWVFRDGEASPVLIPGHCQYQRITKLSLSIRDLTIFLLPFCH